MLLSVRAQRHRWEFIISFYFIRQCRHTFGIVIQNGYEELWTVLNWTNPGAVGTRKQWKTFVEEPLRIGQSRSATEDEQYKAAVCIFSDGVSTGCLIHAPFPACSENSDGEVATPAFLAKVRDTHAFGLLIMNTLSRTKQIIQKQLPEKTDQVVFCPLTPMQLEVYKRILSTEDVKSLIDGDTRCDCGSNKQYAPF